MTSFLGKIKKKLDFKMLSVEIITQQIKHGQILWADSADNKLICTLI